MAFLCIVFFLLFVENETPECAMILMMICKNCGGQFPDTIEKCPYCGTMNKKGAYRGFRKKVSAFIDSLLGLKTDAYESVSRMILVSILRSLVLIAVCVLLAFVASRFYNVDYYNDSRYDKERMEDIEWENANIQKLNEAYEQRDYETIRKLYYENSSIVSHWEHYASYSLLEEFDKLINKESLSKYDMSNIMYFLYYPDYYGRTESLSETELEEYLENRKQLIEKVEKEGYPEEKLQEIYEEYADSYGYISLSEIEDALQEVKNG